MRPRPRREPDSEEEGSRALEKFRQYTRGWERIAAEPDAGELRPWQSDEGPPSHSIPAHLVAKAALRFGREPFRAIHDLLLRAYFVESRDISREPVLRELWQAAGLTADSFEGHREPALLEEVLADHSEAVHLGATGVPAVRLDGNEAVIVGAQPEELYKRWIDRTLARQGSEA